MRAIAGRPLQKGIDELVDYLLFVDEAPLPDRLPGPRHSPGTSRTTPRLDEYERDLDLRERLFRYPCSYLIDSEPFDGMPAEVRERVFVRMFEILSGRDKARDTHRWTPDVDAL